MIDEIEGLGGTILYRCKHAHCLTVQAPATLVSDIAEVFGVARMDGQGEVSSDTHSMATEAYVYGQVIRDIHQFQQYLDANFDGENGTGSAIRFAFADIDRTHTNHLGFLDWPNSPSRVRGYTVCNGSTGMCSSSTSQPGSTDDHATPAAGILFGDLQDGQIASISSSTMHLVEPGECWAGDPRSSTGRVDVWASFLRRYGSVGSSRLDPNRSPE